MLYRIKSPHKDMKLLKIKGKGKRQRHKGKFITIPCQFKKKRVYWRSTNASSFNSEIKEAYEMEATF